MGGNGEIRKEKGEKGRDGGDGKDMVDQQAQSLFPNGGSDGDLEFSGETVYRFL